jgi:hypothetical protein
MVLESSPHRVRLGQTAIRIDTARWPATSNDAFQPVQPSPRLWFDSRDRDFYPGPVTEHGRPGCR